MIKKKIAVLTSGWSVDYVLSLFEGMKKACTNKNIDLHIFTCYRYLNSNGMPNTTGFAIFDLIDYSKYDGIVITPNLFNDDEMVRIQHKKILESGVPAVSINHPLEGLHYVNSENHQTCRDLINHLIKEHDISKFAYIGGPEGNPGSESNYLAYKEALEANGLKVEDQIYAGNCDWTFGSAYEQAKNIFQHKELPQAVVCINDWAAMATIKYIEEQGYSVPDDIKVIGFDDIDLSSKVIPSITTISICAEKMGEEAINLLLSKPKEQTTKIIEAKPIIRQSCGCEGKINAEQIKYSQSFSTLIEKEQRFSSQLRHLEDTFIKHETVRSLSDNLQTYFESRHPVEGKDFAILINQSVIDSLKECIASPKQHNSFDNTLRTLVNIQDGKQADRYTISKEDLFPPNMESDESTLYLFFPIYNQEYMHGYYVSKNQTTLIDNKSGYNWTRNFGTIIEKFRQTSIYRTLSEQMRILSTQDSLSGLFNRAGLETYGTKLFNKNNEEKNNTEIIFIDINKMKIINDKYGHLQGDLAVKTVAAAITNSIPSGYIAVRYGGDEFVIIGTESKTVNCCEKIKANLAERAKRMTLPYNLTVSAGSKVFAPNETETLIQAIKIVDEIMYISKLEFHKQYD